MKNIFLTGDIQVGKSSIINKFINNHQEYNYAGFRTLCESKANGDLFVCIFDVPKDGKEIVMFEVIDERRDVDLDMETEGVDFGSDVGFIVGRKDHVTNKMVPFPEAFDSKGVEILRRINNPEKSDTNIIVMDEIGIMERNSPIFCDEIIRVLDGDVPVIGVLKNKTSNIISRVKERGDTICLEVTKENREDVYLEFEKSINEVLRK